MSDNVLYADFELNSKTNDMFVITDEGTYFNFPGTEYDENHEDITVVDPKSHKIYTVHFNE